MAQSKPCWNCGQPVPVSATKCPVCMTPRPTMPPARARDTTSFKVLPIVILAGLVLAAIIVICVVVYLVG